MLQGALVIGVFLLSPDVMVQQLLETLYTVPYKEFYLLGVRNVAMCPMCIVFLSQSSTLGRVCGPCCLNYVLWFSCSCGSDNLIL